tara:strand:- start:617 stop:1135 length:519 start_codon:yes stop_codon:yes gene_type:complete
MPYQANINFNEQATSTLVENLSFITPSGFRLVIDSQKYPNAQYMVQTIALPDMSISPAVFNTPKRNIGLAPDKIEYNPFDLTFLVDEKMTNYKEIHDWILGMVTEDDYGVRKQRDVTLQVLNSHNNVTNEIQFIDAFPINLSSLPFDATTTSIEYLTAAVTFQYSYFKFKTV